VTVLDAKKCEELGMHMFLAVGKGSDQRARFIHMTYKPAKKPKKKICFIGKASRSIPVVIRSSPRKRWRT
jgi:leucyl aminopeptidase